ncbi:hypothetical protein NYO99_13705 [Pelomonas sp. UHG3]|jgi:hypothetical protein|uniref:Uncharacterized protein n=1 Tax=Roseateles hydrophilus TaxID=2975054 RepID=A0ACC6CCA8_9BURK|nr:hypothetical protein [Pelomonas sp. UHG3]MCY4746036.1 hypothetical protein [Pelomonas sp. UHG3]
MQPNRLSMPLLALLGSLGTAHAQDTELQRCRGLAEGSARLACYDTLADSRASRTRPMVAAEAMPARQAERFGLPARETTAQEVHSSVGTEFAGWGPNQAVTLANGQVWQIADGSSASLPKGARKVVVRRSLFGSYRLEIDGLNTAPQVRRLE